MSFDLSIFPTVGKFLLDTAVKVYQSLNFKFGDYTLNGWVILLGVAIVCIIIGLIARALE